MFPSARFSTLSRRVGILGGSFNPAHGGHVDISLAAYAALGLDEIWWLVAPQNPMKAREGMADLGQRLRVATELVRAYPYIHVTDLETRLGTIHTASTLRRIRRLYPAYRFVWVMGADNLAQLHRWKDWRALFATMPIAVMDRPGYTYKGLASQAARFFGAYRHKERESLLFAFASPPAWIYLHERMNPISASAIRASFAPRED
ncbi:MAG TPA: nicotinate-nucleotide adenylyltransferase [Dongiaceae bacterium]|jgi:nicotinate-nucleotide adenylyltransferase|nr:nicotinate-nucleotide adenylyltransferase [Dongiaceae bacterium]